MKASVAKRIRAIANTLDDEDDADLLRSIAKSRGDDEVDVDDDGDDSEPEGEGKEGLSSKEMDLMEHKMKHKLGKLGKEEC